MRPADILREIAWPVLARESTDAALVLEQRGASGVTIACGAG